MSVQSKHGLAPALARAALICATLGGCARARMQETAAQVAQAVDELEADVERQQLIRTELRRTGVERIARGEAEVAAREASRAADRPQLGEDLEPLLDHSEATSEDADPRFAPTIAAEVERREAAVSYRRSVDTLESLAALLDRLANGAIRDEIELYLELGSRAAAAAHGAWNQATSEE